MNKAFINSIINKITRAAARALLTNKVKCDAQISESQFGFRSGVGTREALFSLNMLVQKCRDLQTDVNIFFVDYEKAFDSVKHDVLKRHLKEERCEDNTNPLLERNQHEAIITEALEGKRLGIKINGQIMMIPLLGYTGGSPAAENRF
ncbi:unnamed protein product [Pieris macdunnoughi]|uniref:Reverse transcriptase domain-containing protein n=1 Tax=Pieris macdunnoughi TaxID=345717 RepID=A0A821XAV5_9NEOP|nr:unnamed protein product [Pieris macdunnoughi]